MSKNCIKCVERPRDGGDLLCAVCRKAKPMQSRDDSRKVPLVWREIETGDKKSLLGHIQGDRDVTLYEIKLTPGNERRGTLTGAFIPDEWDGEHPALVNSFVGFLKWQAELFLIEGYDRLHDILESQVEHPAEADANRLAQAIRDWKASQGLPHTGDLLDDALNAHDLRHNKEAHPTEL